MKPIQKIKFIGLAPKKHNKDAIEQVLSEFGSIRWMKFVPLGFKSYPESKLRSRAALANAAKPAKTVFGQWVKLQLYISQYNFARALFEKNVDKVVLCWNGLNGSRKVFMEAAKDAGCKTLFFEHSPFKDRLTLDPIGVNYNNSLPREIGFYLQFFSTYKSDEYKSFANHISQRSTANSDTEKLKTRPVEGNYLFFPLQVNRDSQLRVFGGDYTSLDKLISRLSCMLDSLPDNWYIRVKEHPSSTESYTNQLLSLSSSGLVVDNQSDTFEQVKKSRGVITINSSVGLEAMFFDVPVIALGKAFWVLDGLAYDGSDFENLKKLLSTPEILTFSKVNREAFLNYLLLVYYPEFNSIPSETNKIDLKKKRIMDILYK